LRYSGITVALREVVLQDKPAELIACSPKATVPVLVLDKDGQDKELIDESLDIMLWALAQHDPDGWLDVDMVQANQLIDANDAQFKPWLDRYKYPDRYAELLSGEARKHCEVFLAVLENKLQRHQYLNGDRVSLVDMAIYSFVRQFAFVDMDWFSNSQYAELNRWLQAFLDTSLFNSVMYKYPQWQSGDIEPEL